MFEVRKLTTLVHSIIDDKPRPSFSAEDRAHLEEMADLAGAEILRASQEQQENKKIELKKTREAWKKSKLVRRVSEKSALETVEEVSTPPASPALISIEDGMRSLGSAVDDEDQLGVPTSSSGSGSHSDERRGSLPESLPDTVSEAGSQELGVTEVPPTTDKKKGRKGVHAGSHRLSPEMKSMLDLSTQLVGESLDLDFCCALLRFLTMNLPADTDSLRSCRCRRHRAAFASLAPNDVGEGELDLGLTQIPIPLFSWLDASPHLSSRRPRSRCGAEC